MAHLIKINLPGGFVSAGDLYEILLICRKCAARAHPFSATGSSCILPLAGEWPGGSVKHEMLRAEIHYAKSTAIRDPNIVSSYVADTIFNQEGWLREGVYKDVLDMFDYQPQLKINLVDNQQTFVPFFSGNINFIASDISNYWFMYIRFPKSGEQYCNPALVYSEDIPGLAKAAEGIILLENQNLFYDQKRRQRVPVF